MACNKILNILITTNIYMYVYFINIIFLNYYSIVLSLPNSKEQDILADLQNNS